MILDNQLINSPMLFRSKLTIPSNVGFGLELELDENPMDASYYTEINILDWARTSISVILLQ